MAGADIYGFAKAWIDDWNRHDLETILSHYAEDVVFRSPKVAIFTGGVSDTLRGREALRAYFGRGIMNRPTLRFSQAQVYRDQTGVALVYTAEDGNTACEAMTLDAEGRVAEARVFYLHPVAYR